MSHGIGRLFVMLGIVIGSLLSIPAFAQDIKEVFQEYKDQVAAAQTVSPLGDDAFGDQVNDYSGALQLSVTDIDLPGNGPPVRISRYFDLDEVIRRPSRPKDAGPGPRTGGPFWDWWFDIPHLYGVFLDTAGWVSSGPDPQIRCNQSARNLAPPPPTSLGEAANYWHGNFLHVPGDGDTELLHVASTQTNTPQDGGTYRWATKSQWFFSCLSATQNGVAGDAFLARAPDGTKYWFDHVARRNAGRSTNAGARDKVFLFPSRVEDRFGNYVVYTYDADYPTDLTSIAASDGRQITVTYDIAWASLLRKVRSITDGARTWTYTYGGQQAWNAPLRVVTLPDNSTWVYEYALPPGAVQAYTQCIIGGFLYADPISLAVTTPSGAKAQFTLNYQWNGRTHSPRICHQLNASTWVSRAPSFFASLSVMRKEVSGPGMANGVWQWTYPTPVAKYEDECATGSCPESKVVTTTRPDGSSLRQTFGVHYGLNEGMLLQSEVVDSAGGVVRSSGVEYQSSPQGQAYPASIATSPQAYSDPTAGMLQPARKVQIIQQGVIHLGGRELRRHL